MQDPIASLQDDNSRCHSDHSVALAKDEKNLERIIFARYTRYLPALLAKALPAGILHYTTFIQDDKYLLSHIPPHLSFYAFWLYLTLTPRTNPGES